MFFKIRFQNVLYILFCLEGGVFLLLVPWTAVWGDNFFLQISGMMDALFKNNFFKGGVSGLGLILIALGIQEIIELTFIRRRDRA